MMKKTVFALTLLSCLSLGTAQNAAIENVNPSSQSVTVGQSTTVNVAYSTSSVNSCTLGVVDSSLASNWGSDSDITVTTTGGSTSTATSPQISTAAPATETEVTVELECSASTGQDPRDTSTFNLKARNPPFLEGTLESTESIDVNADQTYDIEFSISNSGSSQTESAKAVINTPNGYSTPSSLNLKEASQDDGVIRAGKSTGASSFKLDPSDDFQEGTLEIELTSAEIGTTDTIQVELNNPNNDNEDDNDGNNDDNEGNSDPGGGSRGEFVAQPSKTQKMIETANIQNGRAEATISTSSGREVEVKIPEQAETKVQKIGLTSGKSSNITVKVRKIAADEVQGISREPDGKIYEYQEINVSGASDEDISNASITYKVEKSFFQQNNLSPSDMRLERYEDGWQKYSVEEISETSVARIFKSEVPGFSYYAISFEQSQSQDQKQDNQDQQQTQQENKENQEDSSYQIQDYLAVGILLIGILSLLGLAFLQRKKISSMLHLGNESKLEVKIEELKEEIKAKNLSQEEKEIVLRNMERAENLVEEGRTDDAKEVIENLEENLGFLGPHNN